MLDCPHLPSLVLESSILEGKVPLAITATSTEQMRVKVGNIDSLEQGEGCW